MARKLRVEYPGAIYHAINRSDQRELIFKDQADRTPEDGKPGLPEPPAIPPVEVWRRAAVINNPNHRRKPQTVAAFAASKSLRRCAMLLKNS
jgi:hypothetical protein